MVVSARKYSAYFRTVLTLFSVSLAFTDIVKEIRHQYGSENSSPQGWAEDSNIRNIVKHITFSEFPAADISYHTMLNELYERYQIPACDIVNHADQTSLTHILHFRSWRGYHYKLPAEVIDHVAPSFGPQGHLMEGYMKAAEWMENHGRQDMVESMYSY